eukprot:3682637-Amphidinium_carterae.1
MKILHSCQKVCAPSDGLRGLTQLRPSLLLQPDLQSLHSDGVSLQGSRLHCRSQIMRSPTCTPYLKGPLPRVAQSVIILLVQSDPAL